MKEEIEKDLALLNKKGYIPFCKRFNNQGSLNEKYKLKEDKLPLYFTGKLDANIVTVDLNPLHTEEDLLNYFKLSDQVTDYSSYEKFCEDFGSYKYSHPDIDQRFDRKWIDFFEGFGLKKQNKQYPNDRKEAEEFRNSKLQLEFVPYSSEKFSFKNFNSDFLNKRVKNILEIINRKKREFIFITGSKSAVKERFNLKDRQFLELPMNNNGHPNIGFKKINNQILCFVSSFKDGRHISNNHKLYGKYCRKAYNEFEKNFN